MNNGYQSSLAARLYLVCVIASGVAVTAVSGAQLYFSPQPYDWLILAALTLLTGTFTVRIPGLLARISVSDAFVFASVLLFGPSVATVIVAIDSMVATFWMLPENRSLLRSAFNLAAAALAIFTASHVFLALANTDPGHLPAFSKLVVP